MADDKPSFHLRQQLLDDQQLGDIARDVQKVFNLIPPTFYKKFRSFYSEPMVLGIFLEPPLSIELVRITTVVQSELPVRCGGMVHYVYKPQQGGAIVTSIDGLSTAGTRLQYDFVFRITFSPIG